MFRTALLATLVVIGFGAAVTPLLGDPLRKKEPAGVRLQPEWCRAFALGMQAPSDFSRAPSGTGLSIYPSPPWVGPGLRSYSDAMRADTGKKTPNPPVVVVLPDASVTVLKLPPEPVNRMDVSGTTLRVWTIRSR